MALAATALGGVFAEYHIASQTEAYKFYNAASNAPVAIDVAGPQNFVADLPAFYSDGFFGANKTAVEDIVWFLSDEDLDAGKIIFHKPDAFAPPSFKPFVSIADNSNTFAMFDTTVSISWLLVADNAGAGLPGPSPLALMALGLIGLGASRRRSA
ncbi:MAG: hypothetical protein KUG79_12645 [Pseudomonadales bacterium]|nr:hypothetical protein [Pseudomonadales bacterium]